MASESSFSSIQNLISSRLRPQSGVIHSTFTSETNYIHLLRSLQPPSKEPPEDTVARLEGRRRGAGTVLLFESLGTVQGRELRAAWNAVKQVGLFQGDNFAEYFSSVGSMSKLRDIEILRRCERAFFRCFSRRIASSFTKWKEWTKWLHIANLSEIPRILISIYRAKVAIPFNCIREKAKRMRFEREGNMQKAGRLVLVWMKQGSGGMKQTWNTWKWGIGSEKVRKKNAVQTQMLKYKVRGR